VSDQATPDISDPAHIDANAVLVDVGDDGVAMLTLNRPERRNAWTPALERRFFQLLDELATDERVRVVVLTGAGKSFCPGVDSERLDNIAGKPLDYTGRVPASRTLGFPKPLIAAINGGCAGVGMIYAMLCDVRFMSSTARMSTAFARRGLPAEQGFSWILPRVVGMERALDLLLSARTIEADEALRIGLVGFVTAPDDLLPKAMAYARDMATNCSPTSLALIKHQVLADLEADYFDGMSRSYRAMAYMSVSVDFREGIDAFLQKRDPVFPPLKAGFDAATVTTAEMPAKDIVPMEYMS
jgi:enoyl-CoA hydratase/carnithine racemase